MPCSAWAAHVKPEKNKAERRSNVAFLVAKVDGPTAVDACQAPRSYPSALWKGGKGVEVSGCQGAVALKLRACVSRGEKTFLLQRRDVTL